MGVSYEVGLPPPTYVVHEGLTYGAFCSCPKEKYNAFFSLKLMHCIEDRPDYFAMQINNKGGFIFLPIIGNSCSIATCDATMILLTKIHIFNIY